MKSNIDRVNPLALTIQFCVAAVFFGCVSVFPFSASAGPIKSEEKVEVSDITTLRDALLGSDTEAQTATLRRLIRDPKLVASNIDNLVAVAQQSSGNLTDRALREFRSVYRGGYADEDYWSFSRRSSVILLCIADAIREMPDEVDRQKELNRFLPVARHALAGGMEDVPRQDALTILYYCVFFPLSSDFVMIPNESPARQEVLTELSKVGTNGSDPLTARARNLAFAAACVLPAESAKLHENRDYILGGRYYLSGIFQESQYRAAQQRTNDELLRAVTSAQSLEGEVPFVDLLAISKRLPAASEREELVLNLLRIPKVRQFYWRFVTPGFTENDSSLEDKRLVDAVLGVCESDLPGSKWLGKQDNWVVSCVNNIIILDDKPKSWNELKSCVKSTGECPYHPYALGRVIDVLGHALAHKDEKTREYAAYRLGEAAWLGQSAAEAALDKLGSKRPTEAGPFRNAWDNASEALKAYSDAKGKKPQTTESKSVVPK